MEVLQRTQDEELLYYLLQLVQALRYEATTHSRLATFLVSRATKNTVMGTLLHWQALSAASTINRLSSWSINQSIYQSIYQSHNPFTESSKSTTNQPVSVAVFATNRQCQELALTLNKILQQADVSSTFLVCCVGFCQKN